MDESTRVGGAFLTTDITLRPTEEGLEVTCDVGDQETTVVLDAYGVRKLRLALQRYERGMK